MAEEDMTTADLNKTINEEYKLWKKNSPFLYDLVITHALDWPTLTVQWFPDKESPADKDYTVHRVLLGSHTSGNEDDHVIIATVHLPKPDAELKPGDYDGEKQAHQPRVIITQQIVHEGEVNRARYMPQNPDLIATKTVGGDVLVFDRTKHTSVPAEGSSCRPEMRLKGHSKEGYGLSWNPTKGKEGHLLSGSEDTTVCHWDVRQYAAPKTKGDACVLQPIAVYKGHDTVVNDVMWHPTDENIFGSVGDDKALIIWDTRKGSSTPSQKVRAHDAEINSLAWAPASENVVLTGSTDATVALWDIRSLARPLHTFTDHKDEILQLAWSPTHETIFASASADRRIHIWDVSKIGLEQTPEDAEDGPPELIFIHGGHTARPTDLAWMPNSGKGDEDEWCIASAAEDNVLQIWAPTATVTRAEEVPIEVDDLE